MHVFLKVHINNNIRNPFLAYQLQSYILGILYNYVTVHSSPLMDGDNHTHITTQVQLYHNKECSIQYECMPDL